MPTTYKLTYFNARGRAETIRYIFALAKVKYEDIRITFDQLEEVKQKAPFKQLPFLEVDGKPIGQSMAICRFLVKEFGLAGKNNFENALVDSLSETAMEIREKLVPIHLMKDEEKKAEMMTEMQEKILPEKLEKLEAMLKKNQGGDKFFVGNKATLADLQFYASLEMVRTVIPDALEKYEKLEALFDRVAEIPEIADWIKNRPDSP